MNFIFVSILAMFLRIILLGAERIFLKKLNAYDSIVIASLFFLIAAIFLTPVFFFISDLGFHLFYLSRFALVSSLLYAFGFFLYVRAIAIEDTSLIAPLYNSSLLWLMLFGIIFLDEGVTVFRIIGGSAIFVGMFFLYPGNFIEKLRVMRESTGSIYMILGSILIAVGRTIDTLSIRSVDPKFYAFAINLYVGLYLLLGSLILRRGRDISLSIKNDLPNLLYAGITNGWSYLFLLIAIQGLELTVAEPLSLLSVFVTAILAKLVFDEPIVQRLLGTIIMVAGAVLLFL